MGEIILPIDLTSKETDRVCMETILKFERDHENKEINMAIKPIFDTCILKTLLLKNTTGNFKKYQNTMESSMMGKRLLDRIGITAIKKNTRTKDITMTIRKLKWK